MAAATTPTSTYKTTLAYKSGNAYTKLVDIKDYPDLMQAPDTIETTTLSDAARTYILGIQGADALTFTANYVKSDFSTINGLTGEQEFQVQFGDSGEDGIFSFKGLISVTANGAGVNEVHEMTITIAPTTAITFS